MGKATTGRTDTDRRTEQEETIVCVLLQPILSEYVNAEETGGVVVKAVEVGGVIFPPRPTQDDAMLSERPRIAKLEDGK